MEREAVEIGAITRKIARHIFPLILLSYFISFLDRSNVGIAALTMNKDLGLSPQIFGLGGTLFALGFVLFEVPSNMILYHVGSRRWIARIMFTWGLVVVFSACIQGTTSFLTARFLLGVFEAGLVPGVLYYMSKWFTRRVFATYTGIFISSAVLAPVIGNPLGALLLQMDGIWGLRGWQWLFILEGIPALLLAFVVYRYLPDGPEEVTWLSTAEKQELQRALERDKSESGDRLETSMRSVWGNGQLWAVGLAATFIFIGFSGLYLFLPQIIKMQGDYGNVTVGFLASLPLLFLALGGIAWSWNSDRTNERVWHTVLASLLAFVGFAFAAYAPTPTLSLAGITVGAVGLGGALFTLYSFPVLLLTGGAAAVGFAIFNSMGNVGNALGPMVVGFLRQWTSDFSFGLGAISVSLLLAALTVFLLRNKPAFRHKSQGAEAVGPDRVVEVLK